MQESSLKDSTMTVVAVSDSATSLEQDVGRAPDGDTLAFAFETAIDDMANHCSERSAYSLEAVFSGYENGSQSTYYFDKDMTLTYLTTSWDSEGSSGTSSLYFLGDSLVAAREENQYDGYQEIVLVHTAFKPAFGISKTNGTDDDSSPTVLAEKYYRSRNDDTLNEVRRLLALLKENADSVSVEDKVVRVHLENVVNYGEDFTETQDFRIDKSLFESIVKD
jgi:hypothetical protein